MDSIIASYGAFNEAFTSSPAGAAWQTLQGGAKHLAELASMDTVLIKFVLSVYGAFILAWVQRILPSSSLRHAWSALCGLFLMAFIFEGRAVS